MADEKKTDEKAAQTAMRQEIATIALDVTAPLAGFVLRPRDETLIQQGGGLGLRIYEDLIRDPHCLAVLRKRRMAVVAREWSLEAASTSPADAAAKDFVADVCDKIPFDRLCLSLLNGLRDGYAVVELIWGAATIRNVTRLIPVKIKMRGARRFAFDRDENLRLLTWAAPVDGEPLPDRKFIVSRFGQDETEDPYGLGLGPTLFWPIYFKRQGIAFWLTFIERFAAPTAIGQFPPNTAQEEQDKLLAALQALSQETGITMPEGVTVKLLEAMRSGSVDSYEKLCRYMDEQISEAVLGETLTTNIGTVGSKAAGTVHNEVREELTDADADLLSDTLYETLCTWLVAVNMPGAAPPRIWREKPNNEDLKVRAERDNIIAGWGFEPSPEYVHDTYGGEWTKKAPPPPAPPAPVQKLAVPPAPGAQADPAAFAEAGESDAVDRAIDDLLADDGWERLVAPMIEGLEEDLAKATNEEEATRILARHFERMSVDALAEKLARATFAARLAGEGDEPLADRQA